MNRKQKRNLCRILCAGLLLVLCHFLPITGIPRLFLYLVPYLLIGYDILIRAVKGILRGQPFDENFLMAVATVGALLLAVMGRGDYAEAVAVMLFYQIGEWFEGIAVGKSRRSIRALMDIRPDIATLVDPDSGAEKSVSPEEVPLGSLIAIRPGERVPLDGIVERGTSTLDTAALTGESLPWEVHVGDSVASGCINVSGLLYLRTTTDAAYSTVSRILTLAESASERKARTETFISRFARWYTPIVCYSALALALLPPVGRMLFHMSPMWGEWLYRALTFLVISCPCALVISIPLTFFAGIGGAGSKGMLIKGAAALETLASVDTVAFDKTGTLTEGKLRVTEICAVDSDDQKLLYYTSHAEMYSTHPAAVGIRLAYGDTLRSEAVTEVTEHPGGGVTACVDGISVFVGNRRHMEACGFAPEDCPDGATAVHVAVGVRYMGYILLQDRPKEGAARAIRQLRQVGVRHTVMLTGDREGAAEQVAQAVGVDAVHAELLPEDKVTCVEALLQKQAKGHTLAFAGDGINDAPVLALADVGIAMGLMGSDAAMEAADVVLMDDDIRSIARAIRHARRCMTIVRENIVFAIGIKVLCLLLGAFGYATLWMAIFADVGVMVLAVLNAIRAMRVR